MGAIQGSINQSAASIALAAKMVGDEKDRAISEGLEAKEKITGIVDEMPGLGAELSEKEAALGLTPELSPDRRMAEIALENVRMKIQARTELMERLGEKLKTANKWKIGGRR